MAASDKELELQLMEAGNMLVEPPSSVDELIPLLDQVESCLSRVEQSPSQAMQNALSPSLKALVAEQLLRHPDNDVKVAVAACVSEITRITAPEAPYDDDQMREIFQLIVSSFEHLSDKSSRSFIKRISILETVAKVRSCVVMLDLECDALIIEMFQHFLKEIRDHHSEIVFTSMATIMTLVLEESEDIPVELLSPILVSVKRDNEEVLPVARRLAERVLENCASKLKPYLTQAVENFGFSFDDYSSVVASICQVSPSAVDQSDTVAEKHVDDESKPAESPLDKEDKEIPEEAVSTGQGLANEKSPKSVVSNGRVQTAEDNLLTDASTVKKQEDDHLCDKSKNDDTSTVAEPDRLEVEKIVNSDSRSEEITLETGKKSDSKSTKPSDNFHVDEKETETSLDLKNDSKDDAGSLRDNMSVNGAVSSENKRETDAQSSAPKPTEDESAVVASPTPSGSIPDESHFEKAAQPESIPDESRSEKAAQPKSIPDMSQSKKAAQPKTIPDESHSKKAAQPERKESLSEETTPSVDDVPKKVSEGMSDSEVKASKQSGKKVATVISNKVNAAVDVDESKKESGSASGSEAKSRTQSSKKVSSSSNNLDEPSSRQLEDKKKRARGKVPEKDGTKTSTMNDNEEVVASPKSVKSNKHDSHMEENSKTSTKRKYTANKEKASGSTEYGENLVGLKVKVWWPKDRAFYEGVIHSYDAVKKKHKVNYDDGDQEILNLKREKWEVIEDQSGPDEEEAADHPSPAGSSELPQKKKAKTAEPPSKKTKMDASPKRGGGTSSGKSKGVAAKSFRKTKEDRKVDSKSKDAPNSVSKSDSDNVTKSKDHITKSGSKSFDTASKAGCCYPLPIHFLHFNFERKPINLSFPRTQSQFKTLCSLALPTTTTHDFSTPQQENPNRTNSYTYQDQKSTFLQQFYSTFSQKTVNNQDPDPENEEKEEDKHPKNTKFLGFLRVIFTNMWWTDLKAAVGQRINVEGLVFSVRVFVKDRHLALPHVAVRDIRCINWSELRRRGFKGVVFDKDNTITVPYSLTLWPPLRPSIEQCKDVFGPDIAVFSNSAGLLEYDYDGSKAKKLEGTIGIKVIRHKVKKPAGTAEEIEKHFGYKSSQLIMVGDRPFTDVVYGNRNGFLTILTEPLSVVEEPFIVRQVRKLELTLVNWWFRRGLNPVSHKLLSDATQCVKDPHPL